MSALFEKAELVRRTKQGDVAIKVCRDALDVIKAAGLSGSELQARAESRLGAAARDSGDKQLAEDSYRKAVETLRALEAAQSPLALHCMKGIALMRGEMGDLTGALEWIDRALAGLSVLDPANRPYFLARDESVDFLNMKGEYLVRSDPKSPVTWKKSYESLATAAEVADRLRIEQKTTIEAKERIFDPAVYESVMLRLNLCEMLVNAEPGTKWLAEAFRTSEESKARVFLEQLGRSRSTVIGGLPEALAARETELQERLAQLHRQIRRNEVTSFDSREPIKTTELLSEMAAAQRAMDDLQSTIARDYPLVAATRRPNPCTVEQARACLAPNEVALIYVCGGKLCDAILVKPLTDGGPSGVSLIPLPGPGDFGESLGIMTDPDALQVRDFYERAGAELYRMLIEPVEKQIEGRNLLIIPDGPLALLNFEVLRDRTGRFLVETRHIRYSPSMTALHLNRVWDSKRPRPGQPFLGIGDPIYSPDDPRQGDRPISPAAGANLRSLGENLPRLTAASREVHEAGKALGAPAEDVWTGLDASETRLKAASSQGRLADYRLVHFAIHGRLGSGPGRPPALVLSLYEAETDKRPPTNDGLLTIGEASAIKLNADLVVLSGCHTGRGEMALGEGVTGLARGFLNAGTRGVLCSLWTLDDEEATDSMLGIYRSIVAGQDHAVALGEAKRKMIRAGLPPFRWAPLILIGQ